MKKLIKGKFKEVIISLDGKVCQTFERSKGNEIKVIKIEVNSK